MVGFSIYPLLRWVLSHRWSRLRPNSSTESVNRPTTSSRDDLAQGRKPAKVTKILQYFNKKKVTV
jgi:hypothetical protein